MSEGFQFLDIIFFAMVAAFIVLRLRSVLGRRTGHERPPPEALPPRGETPAEDNVVSLPERAGAPDGPPEGGLDIEDDVRAGLTQIRLADRGFDLQAFLSGARVAYETVVGAFAAGDLAALRPLLGDEDYARFASAIKAREEAERAEDVTLVSIKESEVVEARLKGRIAEITVRFVSELIRVIRDASGTVVEGDPKEVQEVVDIWTFSRNTRSPDPNWTLVATRTG